MDPHSKSRIRIQMRIRIQIKVYLRANLIYSLQVKNFCFTFLFKKIYLADATVQQKILASTLVYRENFSLGG